MLAQDTFIPGSILLSFVAEYLIYPTDQLRNLEDNQNIRGKGNFDFITVIVTQNVKYNFKPVFLYKTRCVSLQLTLIQKPLLKS